MPGQKYFLPHRRQCHHPPNRADKQQRQCRHHRQRVMWQFCRDQFNHQPKWHNPRQQKACLVLRHQGFDMQACRWQQDRGWPQQQAKQCQIGEWRGAMRFLTRLDFCQKITLYRNVQKRPVRCQRHQNGPWQAYHRHQKQPTRQPQLPDPSHLPVPQQQAGNCQNSNGWCDRAFDQYPHRHRPPEPDPVGARFDRVGLTIKIDPHQGPLLNQHGQHQHSIGFCQMRFGKHKKAAGKGSAGGECQMRFI